MHKTGACLPKQWQTGPRVQARVLDLGLPPEQLLAPARGCTLRQQDYSLSKCNEHVCHDYARFKNIKLKETKLRSNLGFSQSRGASSGIYIYIDLLPFRLRFSSRITQWICIVFIDFSGQIYKGFMMTLIHIIHLPFFNFQLGFLVQVELRQCFNNFQKFCKNYSGLSLAILACFKNLRLKV